MDNTVYLDVVINNNNNIIKIIDYYFTLNDREDLDKPIIEAKSELNIINYFASSMNLMLGNPTITLPYQELSIDNLSLNINNIISQFNKFSVLI